MKVKCAKNLKGIARVVDSLVGGSSKASNLLRDATMVIGLASDPEYGVPASAVSAPIYVGDSALLGSMVGKTAELDALYRKSPVSVDLKPRYNPRTNKYDMFASKAQLPLGFTGDSGELIGLQTISPWNASFFPEIYRQPLLYSHARDLVKRKTSTNPWAETQALLLAAYSGWGAIAGSGTVGANLSRNVNVQSGMMINPIINIKVFFNFTVEEMQRAEGTTGSPFAGSLMVEKQRYAQYVIDMITDYLTYFGNAETKTPGLFDVNGKTTWAGKSLAEIAKDTSNAAKGNAMYKALSDVIADFMGESQNKFDIVRVAMAPQAYNLLTSTPYSDVYNPKATLAIFADNFEAGVTKSGSKPKIEFYSDPFLSAKNDFNKTGLDHLVITAPEVGAGADDEKQDILLLGVPLENFVYPVYPNSYDQQHAVLRRYSGVFAPVEKAVKVYAGFGVK